MKLYANFKYLLSTSEAIYFDRSLQLFSKLQCLYDNQSYGVNQLITTSDCKKTSRCKNVNENLAPVCFPLCKILPNPECDPKMEVIRDNQVRLNGTACRCTENKECFSSITCADFLLKS